MSENLLSRIRAEAPLIHNITNYVVMNTTANALVINIGTLSPPWVEAMHRAAKLAASRGIPIVLDPVGCGATPYRTATAQALIRSAPPTLIRGNASEIRALRHADSATKGVDSLYTPDDAAADAQALSRSLGCVVTVSGAVDLLGADERVARVANGHPLMASVTGMGCTASALSGACLAVAASPFAAATAAMAITGIAGEMAAAEARGPGSFQMHFLDALYRLDDAEVARRQKISLA